MNEYFADEWLNAINAIDAALRGSFGSAFFGTLLTIDQYRPQMDHILLRFSQVLSEADCRRGCSMAEAILSSRNLPVLVTCDYGDYL